MPSLLPNSPDLNFIIVNYRKSNQTLALLAQILHFDYQNNSVTIVDNSGCFQTSTFESYPTVTLLSPGRNLGYSKAVNLAVAASKPKPSSLFLLLSPDIHFPKNFNLASCIHEFKLLDASAYGISQLNPDGSYEPIPRRLPSITAQLARKSRTFKRFFSADQYVQAYTYNYNPDSHPFPVDWLQSSFLLFTPKALDSNLRLFDERFFVFMADVDLGSRLHSQSKAQIFDPRFCVMADGQRATPSGLLNLLFSHAGRIHFFDALKYYFKSYFF